MTQISRILTGIIRKISNTLLQWENRGLLAKINKVYGNGLDDDEKRLLKAYRKSFRKIIEDEW